MRISFNLGNQQQQIGTVDKCEKKLEEQKNDANHNAEFKETSETLRLHRSR